MCMCMCMLLAPNSSGVSSLCRRPVLPLQAELRLGFQQKTRGMEILEPEGEAPTSFFLILHRLYSRILTSLQVAVDHLAEPETALQDLTTLHNQAH